MSSIDVVGVVGAGTMGQGIAHVCATAGIRTFLYDVTLDQAERGHHRVAQALQRGVEKAKLTAAQREAALARLTPTAQLSDFKVCELVIEAVPEDMMLKQTVFQQLSEICPGDTLLATNTSSLPVTEIAATAKNPSRVLGMHFFNPVPAMKLLEIVRALQTSDETVAAVREVGERLGKELIEVEDNPGFASTRLGIALGMEAIRMVEARVASAQDIDRAMELGYGHPMGPLKLTDLVGLDVRLAIAEHLHRELGSDAFRPPQLLKKMVRAGRLGKKTGEGFYKYPSPS
jgi:3-hydroxybutyryl-CoA dehydrogenase